MAPHTAIDPNQRTRYRNAGLDNLGRLGLAEHLTLVEQPSHLALPRLVGRGERIDLAFIDGGHRYDQILIDWYYVDLLLDVGGYVFLHDTWLPATRMVAAFIEADRGDYERLRLPVDSLAIFRKTGDSDDRRWDHFVPFGAD